MTTLANLALHHLVAAKAVDEQTYRNLVAQPHVLVRALSGMLLERPNKTLQRVRSRFHDNIKRIISLLARHSESRGPAWLRPILLAARAESDRIDPLDVEALAELGHRAMSCFTDLLAHQTSLLQSLDKSFPAVVRLLNADFSSAHGIVNTLLSASLAKDEHPSAAHRARIDVLSLLCDVPHHRFDLIESVSDNDYLDEIEHTLHVLNHDLRAQVTERVVTHLHDSFSSLSPQLVQRLDKALGTRITDRYLDMLAQQLVNGQVREVLSLDLPHDLSRRLANRPRLTWFGSLVDLRVLVKSGANASEVSDGAIGATRNRPAAVEVVNIVCEYADTADTAAVDRILAELSVHDENGVFVALQVRDHLLSAGTASGRKFITHVNDKLRWYTLLSRSGAEPEGPR